MLDNLQVECRIDDWKFANDYETGLHRRLMIVAQIRLLKVWDIHLLRFSCKIPRCYKHRYYMFFSF